MIIIDGNDVTGLLAGTMAAGASGTVRLTATVLILPEEIDAASKIMTTYRPPGQ